jgi:hypothetical protein
MSTIMIPGSPYGSCLSDVTKTEDIIPINIESIYMLGGGSATLGEIVETLGGIDRLSLTREEIKNFCDKNPTWLTKHKHRYAYFITKGEAGTSLTLMESNGYQCLHKEEGDFDSTRRIKCIFPVAVLFVLPKRKD